MKMDCLAAVEDRAFIDNRMKKMKSNFTYTASFVDFDLLPHFNVTSDLDFMVAFV